jgi:hypothetical protein
MGPENRRNPANVAGDGGKVKTGQNLAPPNHALQLPVSSSLKRKAEKDPAPSKALEIVAIL